MRGLRKAGFKRAPFPDGITVLRLADLRVREVITGTRSVEVGKWEKDEWVEVIRTDPLEVSCGVQKRAGIITNDLRPIPIGAAFLLSVTVSEPEMAHSTLLRDYWRTSMDSERELKEKNRSSQISYTFSDLSKRLQSDLVSACRPLFGERTHHEIATSKRVELLREIRTDMRQSLENYGLQLENVALEAYTPLPEKDEIEVEITS